MEISLKTTKWQEAIDITELVEKVIERESGKAALLFNPSTTSALTINEGYDKAVMRDVLNIIDELTPRLDFEHHKVLSEDFGISGNPNSKEDFRYREGNSPAHAKASLIGSSLLIPIKDNKLLLGQYQKIFFLEFDGPKERKIEVSII
jgi:thiamine phosphate synthase YjbQ (UPF0047 family)